LQPDKKAKESSGYSSKFYLRDPSSTLNIEKLVHHGDQFDKDTMSLEVIAAPSTSKCEQLPDVWDADGKLSEQYLAKCEFLSKVGDAEDDAEARRKRVTQADEDANRLHRSHVQRGSDKPIDFESILDRGPNGIKERVLCTLACKGILNVNSLGDETHDITGDCYLILTETEGNDKIRRIYFYQVP
jgi:hypothetical protein